MIAGKSTPGAEQDQVSGSKIITGWDACDRVRRRNVTRCSASKENPGKVGHVGLPGMPIKSPPDQEATPAGVFGVLDPSSPDAVVMLPVLPVRL